LKNVFKSIRCPLYGFIDLTKTETSVLDTAAMQRLARIKQLSHSYIVYPGAVHTRLEHSLGTLHVAGKICENLELSSDEKQVVRLAALLHDIGQGPFSHIWEEPMRWINGPKFSHEEVTKLLIDKEPEIVNALGGFKSDVLKVFTEDSLCSDIISSSIDADKLDYLRRDSYHTGVSYGRFDFDRVMHTICKISEPERDYLGISEKGKEAIENYRLARYAMHTQVYEHHTRIIADNMFLKAVKLALTNGCIKTSALDISDKDFLQNYIQMDDFFIQHLILQSNDTVIRDLIGRIRRRKLMKRALDIPLNKAGIPDAIKRQHITKLDRKQTEEIEIEIADAVGIDPAYVIVHIQNIKIKLYDRFWETIEKREKPIYVKDKDESVTPLDEESPFSLLSNQINSLYVFCPEEYKEKVRSVAKEKLKL
jgi:uncharacterized protein